MKKIAVFPGQGSQYLGMGKDFYDNFRVAKDVFNEIDDVLSYKLSSIIFGSDEVALTNTENAQPALMAVSVAISKVLDQECGISSAFFDYAAGHSLGEYSALCFSGSLDLASCTSLLKIRAGSMANACPNGFGGMAAVIGCSVSDVELMIQKTKIENEVLVIANDNCAGQVVVSGNIASVENLVANAKNFGARMAVKLQVSGPFHSPLMSAATQKMLHALESCKIAESKISIIQNINALPTKLPSQIKEGLVRQIEGRVRWSEIMDYCNKNNVTELYEIGAKNVLCGLAKRSSPEIKSVSIEKVEHLKLFLKMAV